MELLHNTQKKTCYSQEVFVFNLPAPGTCKPTRWCSANCYAQRSHLNKIHREARYKISLSSSFPNLIKEEIGRKKIKIVRVHSTGDFYSEDYVRKWIEIGQCCPNIFFRTSTRRLDLAEILSELNKLPNFVVRESLDPSRKEASMNLPLEVIETFSSISKCNTLVI